MWQRNYVQLPSGERIRFALLDRGGVYSVRFEAPDGRRVLRATGQSKKPAAIDEAQRLIFEEYNQKAPSNEVVDWSMAENRLAEAMTADGKRPRTIEGYIETLRQMVKCYPNAKGPADIKDGEDFKRAYTGRAPKTLHDRIVSLKAIFGWFKRLKFVEANPFEDVTAPKLDRREIKYVRGEDIDQFLIWLAKRYANWKMPELFFTVKAMSGCRLHDECSLPSSALKKGGLVFPADVTKNRSERYVPLPEDVFKELDAYKGETYLWEKYPAELVAVNKAKGNPTHRQKLEFSPDRLYMWILTVMQDYQKETGLDLSSHDFRRAALTRTAEAGFHPKDAAQAFDLQPETMMKYYTAVEKEQAAQKILGGMADKLRPKGMSR